MKSPKCRLLIKTRPRSEIFAGSTGSTETRSSNASSRCLTLREKHRDALLILAPRAGERVNVKVPRLARVREDRTRAVTTWRGGREHNSRKLSPTSPISPLYVVIAASSLSRSLTIPPRHDARSPRSYRTERARGGILVSADRLAFLLSSPPIRVSRSVSPLVRSAFTSPRVTINRLISRRPPVARTRARGREEAGRSSSI